MSQPLIPSGGHDAFRFMPASPLNPVLSGYRGGKEKPTALFSPAKPQAEGLVFFSAIRCAVDTTALPPGREEARMPGAGMKRSFGCKATQETHVGISNSNSNRDSECSWVAEQKIPP